MTKQGHQLTGIGAGALALVLVNIAMGATWEWYAGIMAWFGSTAPDWLELPYGWKGTRRLSVIAHRTWTHWLPVWLVLAGWALTGTPTLLKAAMAGFAVGGLVHLAMDIPNPMGIPILLPTRRVSLYWWKSQEHVLELTLGVWLFGFLALWLPGMIATLAR